MIDGRTDVRHDAQCAHRAFLQGAAGEHAVPCPAFAALPAFGRMAFEEICQQSESSRLRKPGLAMARACLLTDFFKSQCRPKAGKAADCGTWYSMFTGRRPWRNARWAALGIMRLHQCDHHHPIDAAVVPKVEQISPREEGGRTNIIQYGRYLTVCLCLVQGLFHDLGWNTRLLCSMGSRATSCFTRISFGIESNGDYYHYRHFIADVAGGTDFRARHRHGISLVISIGIMARLPAAARRCSICSIRQRSEGPL